MRREREKETERGERERERENIVPKGWLVDLTCTLM